MLAPDAGARRRREPGGMLKATIERADVDAETAELRDRLERLQAENARLRSENRHLCAALDAHVARTRSTMLYGPIELTAGTSVGPRRRQAPPPEGHGA